MVFTPEPALVDAYLAEIAKGYGVKWSPPASGDSDDTGGEGGVKVSLNRVLPTARRSRTTRWSLTALIYHVRAGVDHRESASRVFTRKCGEDLGGGKERRCADAQAARPTSDGRGRLAWV